MECPVCHSEISNYENICPTCGAIVENIHDTEEVRVHRRRHPERIILPVIGVAVVIAGVLIVRSFFSGGSSGASTENNPVSHSGEANQTEENESDDAKPTVAEAVTMEQIASIQTSSTSSTFSENNLIDGSFTTAWCEGAEGDGAGEYVKFTFESTSLITGFRIWPGHQMSREMYRTYGRPKTIRVVLDDGSNFITSFDDDQEIMDDGGISYAVPFDKPIASKSITFVLVDVYNGSGNHQTAISEIEVY